MRYSTRPDVVATRWEQQSHNKRLDPDLPVSSSKPNRQPRSHRRKGRKSPQTTATLISTPPLKTDADAFDESIEVVKALNGLADEIIDMEERYPTPRGKKASLPRVAPFPDLRLRPDSRDDDGTDGVLQRDDSCEDSGLSLSSSLDESPSFEKGENYLSKLDNLIDRFQINDMLKNFHKGTQGTLRTFVEVGSSNTSDSDTRRSSRTLQRIKAELKRETRIVEKLERRLQEKEEEFSAKLAAQNQKLATLESKLRLQEQIFESQLEEARENWVAIREGALSTQVESLQETVHSLEAKVSELNQENTLLKQEIENEKKLGEEKLEMVQDALFNTEAELDEERNEKLELQWDRNKIEFLLEVEMRKVRALELAEERNTLLLLTERNRTKFLSQKNDRMKASGRKFSKNIGKLSFCQHANEAEENLRRMLKERDQQLELIREILNK